jgi:hypothetical protein
MRESKRLGEILVELKVLSPADLDRVLQALGRRPDLLKFGKVARDMGLVREEHIWAALAVQMRLLPNIEQLTLEQILRALQDEPKDAPPDQL